MNTVVYVLFFLTAFFIFSNSVVSNQTHKQMELYETKSTQIP